MNFDAARLLAHAYLFKVDEELSDLTSGEFVRWMDDIDAGVDSLATGRQVLRRIQEVLNSQGLQLNANKCRILSAEEALQHFCAQRNQTLTILQNLLESGTGTPGSVAAIQSKLRKSYNSFRKAERTGQWEKVQKRYLTLFGKLGDRSAEIDIWELLRDCPSTRGSALRYLNQLGFSESRLQKLLSFIESDYCSDDATLFAAIHCLIQWKTPSRGRVLHRICGLVPKITSKPSENPSYPFGAALWLLVKYGSQAELFSLISDNTVLWERSAWAARQVAAATPRLSSEGRKPILRALQHGGQSQGLQVLANLSRIESLDTLSSSFRVTAGMIASEAGSGGMPANRFLWQLRA